MNDEIEEIAVQLMGETIGYGRTMQLSQQLWREKLKKEGLEGSELALGPCVSFITKCECNGTGCTLCYGCGWIIKNTKTKNELAKNVLNQCYEKIDLYNRENQKYLGGVEATKLMKNIKEVLCLFNR